MLWGTGACLHDFLRAGVAQLREQIPAQRSAVHAHAQVRTPSRACAGESGGARAGTIYRSGGTRVLTAAHRAGIIYRSGGTRVLVDSGRQGAAHLVMSSPWLAWIKPRPKSAPPSLYGLDIAPPP